MFSLLTLCVQGGFRLITVTWQKAPSPEQSRTLSRGGGEIVPLFLRVGLGWTDNVSVAPVLMTQNGVTFSHVVNSQQTRNPVDCNLNYIRKIKTLSQDAVRCHLCATGFTVTCQWKLKASSSFILPSLDGTLSGGAGCTRSEPTATSPNSNRARMANQPPNRGCTHTPNIFCKHKDPRLTPDNDGKGCLLKCTKVADEDMITFSAQGWSVTSAFW